MKIYLTRRNIFSMAFEKRVYEEMRRRNAKYAVFGLVFRDRTEVYDNVNTVSYFSTRNELDEWWKTLELIYEPTERPLTSAVLHLL